MRQVVFSRSAPARLVDVPVPALKAGCVLVRTHFSAISVGTERAASGGGGFAVARKIIGRPQQLAQVAASIAADGIGPTMVRVADALGKWLPAGYSSSGVILEVGAGVSELRAGDRVACAGGGYAVHADIVMVPRRLTTPVPDSVSLEVAAFGAIGAIALHAYRIGKAEIGAHVAVIGLGIIGQLLCQIAAAAGCKVIAMDVNSERVSRASELVAARGVVVGTGTELTEVLSATSQFGVDVVFVCAATASSDPSRLAATIARARGSVVIVGDVGLNLDRQVLYEKELEVRLARSYGPGRYDPSYEESGIDYPYSYVRWTEQRNVASFLDLAARGLINVPPLITHRFSISDAAAAFTSLSAAQDRGPIGGVFEYLKAGQEAQLTTVVRRPAASARASGPPRIALIGPGAFATSVLLPAFAKCNVTPVAIVGNSAISVGHVASRSRSLSAVTDLEVVLADPDIDTVVIATRHDSHASLAIQCLERGKNVYLEKPLATSIEQLEALCEAYGASTGILHVGFNRRFAPFVERAKAFLPAEMPPVMLYRINAGALDPRHWSLSQAIGGGRIVGEVCHFIDLLQFFAGSPVTSVYARALRPDADSEQDASISLSFQNGAIGTIVYTAQGNARLPKEYIEIYAGGKIAVIDNFAKLTLAGHSRRTRARGREDKGFRAEVAAFVSSIASGASPPIPFAESVVTTLATLAVLDSCRSGLPVAVPRVQA